MKQGHCLVVFALILFACILVARLEQVQYDKLVQGKGKMERALQTALDVAAEQIVMDQSESVATCLSLVQTTFFESLYATLGIIDQSEKQDEINQYITSIILMKPEGYYRCSLSEYADENGCIVQQREWTTLQEYSEYILEDTFMNTNQLNLTSVDKSLINTPLLKVTFQGIPVLESSKEIYSGSLDACIKIQKKERYIIDLPVYNETLYAIYHKVGCSYIGADGYRTLSNMVLEEDAIQVYGCNKCSHCIK